MLTPSTTEPPQEESTGARACLVDGKDVDPLELSELVGIFRTVLPDSTDDEARRGLDSEVVQGIRDLREVRVGGWLTQNEFEEEVLQLIVKRNLMPAPCSTTAGRDDAFVSVAASDESLQAVDVGSAGEEQMRWAEAGEDEEREVEIAQGGEAEGIEVWLQRGSGHMTAGARGMEAEADQRLQGGSGQTTAGARGMEAEAWEDGEREEEITEGGETEEIELRLRMMFGPGPLMFGNVEVMRVHPEVVDLSAHRFLTELPEELRACAGRVRVLRVKSHWIEALPTWMGELTSLQKLNLTGCRHLEGLPESVGRLTALQFLSLAGCELLTGLPESVGGLTALQELVLYGCLGLQTPPPAVVREGREAVQQYLRDLAKGSAPCHLVKLVLVGEPRSGKSSLADSLVQRRPATRSYDDRTVGIDVRRWWLGLEDDSSEDYDSLEDEEDEMSPEHSEDEDIEEEGGGGGGRLFNLFNQEDEMSPEFSEDEDIEEDEMPPEHSEDEDTEEDEMFPEHSEDEDIYIPPNINTSEATTRRDIELVANIYDSAGQRVYRASHGAFMSREALFLQVVRSDLREYEAVAAVLAWVEAVQQEAPGAVMGVVWTHLDKLEASEYGGAETWARKLQSRVHSQVKAEVERQVRAVDEAVRQAEITFKDDAAWCTKRDDRDATLEVLDKLALMEIADDDNDGSELGTAMDDKSIQEMTAAVLRLSKLHHEMCELEKAMTARDPKQQPAQVSRSDPAPDLERLREQRVRRPRLLFSFVVSSSTGQGLKELRRGLSALMRDRRLFPHVGMVVPLNYSMLERLAQEGRRMALSESSQDKDDGGDDDDTRPKRAEWENMVTSHVTRHASEELRRLCSQPHATLAALKTAVSKLEPPMDADELHSALRFLHSTGSVLHYGSGTRQHSCELEQIVFMQPQFIIDAIKYVVREPEAEDINDELRAMDKQIRNKLDFKSFHQTGELTRALLSEVWNLAKIKASDQRLMLEVMKAFRLLRLLGESRDAQRERYVVPAMLPHEALPAEYVAPRWWKPARIDNAAAPVDGNAATEPAAMRVVYQVVGGRLPFSFMSELQVSLALPGSKDQHYAPEPSVVDRVAGSVLSQPYKCGGASIREWAVVSQLARSSQVQQVEQEADSLDLARDSIRVVARAELTNQSQDGATDWRLLRRVMQAIEDAGERVPGLWLRKLVVHVDAGGRCSRPEEVADNFHDHDMVTFMFDQGEDQDVQERRGLPQKKNRRYYRAAMLL